MTLPRTSKDQAPEHLTRKDGFGLSSLACIVVTYHPELETLASQLDAIPRDAAVVIVDNASGGDIVENLYRLTVGRERLSLLYNTRNLGLPAAINRGVAEALDTWANIGFLLFLDQDSVPEPGAIVKLLDAYESIASTTGLRGCVGPNLIDNDTGLSHGFHQMNGWRWRRAYPPVGSREPVPCASLNGSGTLTSVSLYRDLNGLDEALFIDHVDTEWSFRVLSAGGFLHGIPDAVFHHRMGEAGRRLWFLPGVWPQRSPQRHYYLFRNAILLMRRDYVPFVWKIWAALKLIATIPVTLVIGPLRLQQIAHMWRGVRHSLCQPCTNRQPL
jgi:rhamnosyltransferase